MSTNSAHIDELGEALGYVEGGMVSITSEAANAIYRALSAPPVAQESPHGVPDQVLCKFYQVETFAALVAAMEHHIEKLQAKLPRDNQPAFTRVREG